MTQSWTFTTSLTYIVVNKGSTSSVDTVEHTQRAESIATVDVGEQVEHLVGHTSADAAELVLWIARQDVVVAGAAVPGRDGRDLKQKCEHFEFSSHLNHRNKIMI